MPEARRPWPPLFTPPSGPITPSTRKPTGGSPTRPAWRCSRSGRHSPRRSWRRCSRRRPTSPSPHELPRLATSVGAAEAVSGSSLGRRRQSPRPQYRDRCRRIWFLSVVHDHRPVASGDSLDRLTYCVGSGLSWKPSRRRLPLRRLQHIGLHLGLVLFHRLRDILLAVLEHLVDQTRQLVAQYTLTAPSPPIRLRDAAEDRPNGVIVLPSDSQHIRCAMVTGLVPLRWPRRFFVLLLSSCGGHSRSQLAKCFSVGKRLTSTPISPRITRAVATSIPSIKVRSTPNAWNNGPVASNRTSLLLRRPSAA